MTPERIAELQDAAMGKRGIEPINPVEVQQLLGEVAFLRARLASVEPKVAAAEKANVDWAAANADLHAVLELVAGNLRAAWEKRDDAPQSANAHLQEASFALVKFAPKDGTLSPNAAALRVLVREEMGDHVADAGKKVEPSLIQCNYDSVDFPRQVVEAIDELDDRLSTLEREAGEGSR